MRKVEKNAGSTATLIKNGKVEFFRLVPVFILFGTLNVENLLIILLLRLQSLKIRGFSTDDFPHFQQILMLITFP